MNNENIAFLFIALHSDPSNEMTTCLLCLLFFYTGPEKYANFKTTKPSIAETTVFRKSSKYRYIAPRVTENKYKIKIVYACQETAEKYCSILPLVVWICPRGTTSCLESE